jgi:hypothetical protein
MVSTVEVYDGMGWQIVYTNNAAVHDMSWTYVSYNLTTYKNKNMQVRFGFSTGNGTASEGGWNIDDVLIAEDECAP